MANAAISQPPVVMEVGSEVASMTASMYEPRQLLTGKMWTTRWLAGRAVWLWCVQLIAAGDWYGRNGEPLKDEWCKDAGEDLSERPSLALSGLSSGFLGGFGTTAHMTCIRQPQLEATAALET
jgi:hypothetical protein